MDTQNISIKSEITARAYNQSTLNSIQRFWNKIVLGFHLNKKRWYILGELKWTDLRTNVICNAGFNAICKRLDGDNTYTGEITYMALGTGTPTPAAADTTLATEVYRNATASSADSANVVYLTAYYTEAEVNGTFTEFGNFIDGTAGAGTGQLWSHVAGFSWVKDALTVLTVSCKYTLISA